ncbi:MAG: CRISPR-associated endoribonuclease Cas6 [Thermoproteota archaeon]|nr:CRISPR-associated endoribonuclease Cas6 [Thermoproteota archaeon]
MRLLVSFQALGDWAYDLKYHHKLQGFLYRLLERTVYSGLHDRRGYKFFCFTNLFPPKDAKTGEVRRFLVSSPNVNFIQVLEDKIRKIDAAHIGDVAFRMVDVMKLEPRVEERCSLVSGTPIVVRDISFQSD